jgi:hypothetical protein
MHHEDPATASPAGPVLGVVAVHLQLGNVLPRVAADGGRRADPAGRVVVRVLLPVDGDDDGARAAARLTITGTAAALRELLAAIAAELATLDPDPNPGPGTPLLTRPHDWPSPGPDDAAP